MVTLINAIFGGIDKPKPMPPQTQPYFSMFFTEDNWATTNDNLSPRNQALSFKTNPWEFVPEQTEWVIWIDGKIQVTSTDFITQCLDGIGNGQIAMRPHPERNCVYEEVDFILAQTDPYYTARFTGRPIHEQVQHYSEKGYPKNNGLHDCCITVMKRTQLMETICHRWWKDCQADYFDQIAIQYRCWDAGIKIRTIEFKLNTFHHVKHLKHQ